MDEDTRMGGSQERFPATRWSAVAAACAQDPGERRRGQGSIVAAYWKPIYKYLRVRWRRSNEEAKDLTQEFFARALERDVLAGYDPERARLRTYLRICVDRLVQNRDRASRALKRGGPAATLSLDYALAEGELQNTEPPDPESMEEFFEREWVRSLFGLAVESLERRCIEQGKATHFKLFERYDLEAEPGESPTYKSLAAEFGLAVTDVTNHLAWTRREFRRLVLQELAKLTGSAAEYHREVRSVLGVTPAP